MKVSIGIYNTQKACMFSYLVGEKQSLINVRIYKLYNNMYV